MVVHSPSFVSGFNEAVLNLNIACVIHLRWTILGHVNEVPVFLLEILRMLSQKIVMLVTSLTFCYLERLPCAMIHFFVTLECAS